MRAKEGPPLGGFSFVMEHPGFRGRKIDPRRAFKVAGLPAESSKQTRRVLLVGQHRALVFVNHAMSRQRLFRSGWKDRTEAFWQEWRRGDGEWFHEVPVVKKPTETVIREPLSPAERVAEAVANGETDQDPLTLPVKRLAQMVAAGDLDNRLPDLLARERSRMKPRSGAIALFVGRIGDLRRQG